MPSPPLDSPQSSNTTPVAWQALPAGIWALGFGSLFMGISSELIHSLLPVFMVSVLGASMLTVGIIEGVAEATAAVMKVFFRRTQRLPRQAQVFAGSRLCARCIHQADLPAGDFRQLGVRSALIGPLLAVALMIWFANNIRSVMWIAVAPAFISVVLLTIYVREPDREHEDASTKAPLTLTDAMQLPLRYWLIVLLGAVFTLAPFSEAFLVLRAQDVGLQLGYVPLVMIVMNVFYAAAAYPAGAAADDPSRRIILLGATTP